MLTISCIEFGQIFNGVRELEGLSTFSWANWICDLNYTIGTGVFPTFPQVTFHMNCHIVICQDDWG